MAVASDGSLSNVDGTVVTASVVIFIAVLVIVEVFSALCAGFATLSGGGVAVFATVTSVVDCLLLEECVFLVCSQWAKDFEVVPLPTKIVVGYAWNAFKGLLICLD